MKTKTKRVDVEKLRSLLCDVAQIFDGWHCDIAWSEWDKSVRQRVSEFQKDLEPTTTITETVFERKK